MLSPPPPPPLPFPKQPRTTAHSLNGEWTFWLANTILSRCTTPPHCPIMSSRRTPRVMTGRSNAGSARSGPANSSRALPPGFPSSADAPPLSQRLSARGSARGELPPSQRPATSFNYSRSASQRSARDSARPMTGVAMPGNGSPQPSPGKRQSSSRKAMFGACISPTCVLPVYSNPAPLLCRHAAPTRDLSTRP